jgi:hypothetical protein
MPSVRITTTRDRNTVEPFTLGVTEPTALNSGAGNMPGHPAVASLTVINGDVTVTAGTTYEDKIINGRLFVNWSSGTQTIVRNVEVRGPVTPPVSGSAVPLVTVQSLPGTMTSSTQQVLFEFVTIRPQTTSSYWDGFGRKGFKTVRCLIEDVNDGWQVFSSTADGLIRAEDEGSCLTKFAQFQPDVANPRPVTHNDGVQNQGSLDEFWMTGTAINARPSTTRSSPLPPIRDELSAVMLNTNTQTRSGVRMDRCWIRGGIYSVNAGGTSGYVEITNSKFERPGTDTWAPDRAISLNPSITRVVTGNTYIDNGATVPVING